MMLAFKEVGVLVCTYFRRIRNEVCVGRRQREKNYVHKIRWTVGGEGLHKYQI